MKRLLIVSHSPAVSLEEIEQAVLDGATDDAIDGVEVEVRAALEATSEDVLESDAVLLVTPCNFGYMSGALKHFFDSTFRDLEDRTSGLPYGLVVKGTTDASGAVRAVESITTGLDWRQARPPLVQEGDVDEDFLEDCRELGGMMAAGLEIGAL